MQRSWKEWEQGIVFSLSSASKTSRHTAHSACLAFAAFVSGRARTASREAPIGAAGRTPLTTTRPRSLRRRNRAGNRIVKYSTPSRITGVSVMLGFPCSSAGAREGTGSICSFPLPLAAAFHIKIPASIVPLGGDAEPSEVTRMEAMSSARATIIGARAGVGDAVSVSGAEEEGASVSPMVVVRVAGGRRMRMEESAVRVALEALEAASSAMAEGDTESALDGQKASRTAWWWSTSAARSLGWKQ
ncbi:hypothetical protein GUJ93_ZPchr0011g26990 [Zizania palustris]|uniref:Uncharacterized protein n=1 Tax=Zizania palustris TaxID=103762 RepID=A0A8J5WLC8_ZIZPA|nr:hypothetical protein GUJ93_ZPchr0011g26990 [Zizania palustris]